MELILAKSKLQTIWKWTKYQNDALYYFVLLIGKILYEEFQAMIYSYLKY